MKNNFLKYLWLTVFVCTSAVISQAQVKPKKAQAAAETPGLLYKITGKDLKKPSYLFGTVHIICTPDMFPMEKLNAYLGETEQLIMELDMDDAAEMQAMQKGILIPNGKTLSDVLTPEQLAKVDELFKNILGVPVEQVKSVRPLMLQMMLITSPKVIGCSSPDSYEIAFMKAAAAKKMPVVGLETVASQFEVLDAQPLETQAKQLYETALDPQKSFDEFKKLLETYKMQNSDALYELIESQMGNDREFQSRLLDLRNKAWIPKIEKSIAEKSSFIAVGGGHLGGKNGVINLLRAKGYKVQAIKL